jgi:hypothetical protein
MQDLKSLVMTWATVVLTTKGRRWQGFRAASTFQEGRGKGWQLSLSARAMSCNVEGGGKAREHGEWNIDRGHGRLRNRAAVGPCHVVVCGVFDYRPLRSALCQCSRQAGRVVHQEASCRGTYRWTVLFDRDRLDRMRESQVFSSTSS